MQTSEERSTADVRRRSGKVTGWLRIFAAALLALAPAATSLAQPSAGALRGQVTDESGAVIPGATVTLTNFAGVSKTLTTAADGTFHATDLAPGRYTVRAFAAGMAMYENTAVEIAAGKPVPLNIGLKVSLEKQQVTVQDQPGAAVSTEASNNASALVLRGADLDALSDDPDDLQADLQALAGPSAGPNGGQIYIDGFTGGTLPPKASIREIRINQNPFSAEFDRLGFGRIEVFTKPGSDKFHGQVHFNFGDDVLNARNPYAGNKPPYQQREYGANLSGPMNKRASFFTDFERREIDDNAIINATILDPSFNIVPFSEGVVAPQRRTTFGQRIDYQLSTNNTLTGRYHYRRTGLDDAGIGQFSLLSRAYNTLDTEQTLQLTETAVINTRAVNETRFQFIRENLDQNGNNSIPAISVLEAFTGGGAQVGRAINRQNHWELQNYTSIVQGRHVVKFGVRARAIDLTDVSPQNFGGTFTFSGGPAPELDSQNQIVLGPDGKPVMEQIQSIERYRRTAVFQNLGMSPEEIRALGGGASQFTIAAGKPEADVLQTDVGLYVQDDWRLRPNVTLSLGLRYETQTNIHDWHDLGPRVGFAWAPGARGSRPGKTVVRGGFGMFYDRFSEGLVLQAERFNGITQQQYVVINPNFYPVVPAIGSLTGDQTTQSIRSISKDLRTPYIMQTAIGVERQLPRNTTFAVTFTNSHAVHLLRARDINAPLAGTFDPAIVGSGLRPFGDIGDIFEYESTGILNQNQMIANLTSRLNRSFTLFTFYVLNHAMSDTDGATTIAPNPYDLSHEYGRSSLDARHRFMMGGSFVVKGNIRLSPFIIVRSGAPFDITTGRDLLGDTVFTSRPAFAGDLTGAGIVDTAFGNFNLNAPPGALVIPRNYGEGPGYFTINLRVGRTFGFGPRKETSANAMPGAGGGGGGGRGGDHGGGRGGPGGMRMGGGGGGFHSIFGDASTDHRFNLVLAASARNLLNSTNPGQYTGDLNSPFFGRANSLAGSFGPAANAGNRRIELQLRLMF